MSIPPAELCARYRRLYVPAVCDALYWMGFPSRCCPATCARCSPSSASPGWPTRSRGRPSSRASDARPGIERITSYLRVFEELTPDSVLVSVSPDTHVGHLGELCCNSAKQHGCAGAILDGNLRDIEGIREIGFQVFYGTCRR